MEGVDEDVRRVDAEPEPERLSGALLPLVHAAARGYFDWLFGGADAAAAALARWLLRPSSELSVRRATVIVRDGGVDGAMIALSGADLVSCRKADSLALLTEVEGQARLALRDRLAAAGELFAPIEGDQWYLSKLAVRPGARRGGLGARLLHTYLEAGEQAGFRRFRVDVEAANDPAIALYGSRGFRVVHDAASEAAGLQYLGLAMEL